MRIRYYPCHSKRDTLIKVINDNDVMIDGVLYEFNPQAVEFPDLAILTNGVINNAQRIDGELHLDMPRFYTQSCSGWDTAEFHEVTP
jgi:hypothetical protein